MGVCVSKQKKNKSCNYATSSQSKVQDFMITQDKQTILLYRSTKFQAQLQPKEYDYTNSHRQYNVILNGAVFAIVNSIERSFNDEPINNDN
ncbi:unnamed protein product (macronuclear) [Paramecium tetraurelia]|uniref:Uncharacterized protein n=1 Tax=Paramecium tetraurelia TaxID=5888 RepID=A0E821_PARTE|nr:uncharacterized protein GSPATT00024166001 [Paramecium tetraurelia]CAK91438.1 unnamed protein product [Paramecium tetraurelia]|eukprot:XP_001458835.1 hypothetical protein (macronuclear) [Paramecium tetraurelia strain d4-2]